MPEPRPRPVVVDTTASPHASLRPLPLDAVTIADSFWAPRRRVNREVSLPTQFRLLKETGRLANFRRAAGRDDSPFQGRYFNDSDVYKWVEAAAWALAEEPDPALAAQVAAVVAEIATAQRADGYLNSYFAGERADLRWTDLDLHELYCAGHLFQAAVALHRATGATDLLEIATRFADHIVETFGPDRQAERPWADGHPEVEMALVELFRETGERRYLDQASLFLDARGHGKLGRPYDRHSPEYHQDHRPFRAAEALVGHAVRALYLAGGAADLAAETDDAPLRAALDRLWEHTVAKKTYISGGLGARYEGEAFGDDYELPNERAYTETCAAIASVMWNWRLLQLDGDARYADALETVLYNGVLPGVSLEGDTYFYQNPLADQGGHRRQPWFGTACCPPNIARLLASLPGYVASHDEDGAWLHLFAQGSVRFPHASGTVRLGLRTDYPWDGEVAIVVEEGDGDFAVRLRIPGWCREGATLAVNDESAANVQPGAYAELRRRWRPGDRVHLSLPMPVRRLVAHPHVAENVGRVALLRGPLLFCVEAADNPGLDFRDLVLPDAAELRPEVRPDLLGGVVVLLGEGRMTPPVAGWAGAAYLPAEVAEPDPVGTTPTPITAIPYAVWANREAGPMAVWLRRA